MQGINLTIVISAPSGSGKTTLINRILSNSKRYEFVISTTTRPKRSGEIEGMSYYFVSSDEFTNMIDNDEFIEWALVYRNYYGTTKSRTLSYPRKH